MNRRGFLKVLGIGAAAATTGAIALVEEELWTPSRTFFLPPAGGWGNRLLTVQQITNEALRILANEMNFTEVVERAYSEAFRTGTGTYSIRVGRPPRYALQALNQIVHKWQP